MAEQRYPEPTVGAVILDPQERILLVRSHKWHGRYVIPGGHIELGESMEEALRREIREETGLEIRDLAFIAFQEFIYDEAFWKKRHYVFFDFCCRTDGGEVTLNEESQAYQWATLEQALAMDIEPYTRRLLERYAQMRQK